MSEPALTSSGGGEPGPGRCGSGPLLDGHDTATLGRNVAVPLMVRPRVRSQTRRILMSAEARGLRAR